MPSVEPPEREWRWRPPAVDELEGEPAYEPYLGSTAEWGLDPLADQQLAGVLMWIPVGLLHLGIGLALLRAWFHEIDSSSGVTSWPS